MSNMLPRWWLEPKYESLLRDADGLAWELRGGSVKAMTEEDFFNETSGGREHTGKANPVAQKWADNMTAHYDELAVAEPIFGDLRNCMELAIVGALMVKADLPGKAGNSLPVLMDSTRLARRRISRSQASGQPGERVEEGSQLADQRLRRRDDPIVDDCRQGWQRRATPRARRQMRAKTARGRHGKWCLPETSKLSTECLTYLLTIAPEVPSSEIPTGRGRPRSCGPASRGDSASAAPRRCPRPAGRLGRL